MLAGFEQPTAGCIFIGAIDITHVPVEKRGIGMVFQNYALFSQHDGGREHRLSARGPAHGGRGPRVEGQAGARHGAARRPRRPQAAAAFRWTAAEVAVARSLVVEPKLVLLDEPLGALDPQLGEQMQYEVKHLHGRLGVTMVYVRHDQVETMTMSGNQLRVRLAALGREDFIVKFANAPGQAARSSRWRAAGSDGNSSSRKNTPLLVPPRM